MESNTVTTDKPTGPRRFRSAVQRPALKLQSDSRLAQLGRAGSPDAYEMILERYREPLERHCSEMVGAERAHAVVNQTFEQAGRLFGDDRRAGEPGPWLYWMSHNLALAELKRESQNGNGASAHTNGNGHVANGNGNGNGASAHTNGNGHVANGNGNGTHAAFAALTFSESARLFTMDSDTRKVASGTRVRVRNSVGHLVPKTVLTPKPLSSASGEAVPPRPGATTAADQPHRLRPAIVIFAICLLASIGAFLLDQSNNVDPDEVAAANAQQAQELLQGFGATGQVPPTGTTVPPTGAVPSTGTTGTTGAVPGATADGSATSGDTGTSTGATGPAGGAGAAGATGATGSAGGTASPSTGTTTPATSEGQGFAGLLTALGVKNVPSAGSPTTANPLGLVLTMLGILPKTPVGGGTTGKAPPPKNIKPGKPSSFGGSSTSGVSPAPTPTPTPTPTPAPKPVKPTLPPLGNAGPTISYTAAKNQKNDVTVARYGKKYTITDRGVTGSIAVNSGCRLSKASGPSKTEVCLTRGVDRFDVNLGNKDDVFTMSKVGTPVSIAGGTGDDNLSGGNGNDSIDGESGDDRLSGGKGNDTVSGSGGEDDVSGDAGNDSLSGGDGNDHIDGGKGTDSIQTDAGDDSVDARDGEADNITCGPGRDTVTADPIDTVASDCESVSR